MTGAASERISLPPIPARDVCGLDDPVVVDGRLTGSMTLPRAIRDADGEVVASTLAVLADSCLGMAMVHATAPPRAMVTAHLHLELLRRIPADVSAVRCSAAMRGMSGYYGLTEGFIDDDSGNRLAYATLGGVSLKPAADRITRSASAEHRTRMTADTYQHIDDLLNTKVIRLSDAAAEVDFRATAALANLLQNLHGGMSAVMGARATDLALRHTALPAGPRLAELRAVFLRAIPAVGARVKCRVALPHLGRRLVVARAELCGPDGRVAVTVDSTYVADSG
jgi:acyl-coenzyme A thioesterase PaaI-like protein